MSLLRSTQFEYLFLSGGGRGGRRKRVALAIVVRVDILVRPRHPHSAFGELEVMLVGLGLDLDLDSLILLDGFRPLALVKDGGDNWTADLRRVNEVGRIVVRDYGPSGDSPLGRSSIWELIFGGAGGVELAVNLDCAWDVVD